jgi:hypothetical protein
VCAEEAGCHQQRVAALVAMTPRRLRTVCTCDHEVEQPYHTAAAAGSLQAVCTTGSDYWLGLRGDKKSQCLESLSIIRGKYPHIPPFLSTAKSTCCDMLGLRTQAHLHPDASQANQPSVMPRNVVLCACTTCRQEPACMQGVDAQCSVKLSASRHHSHMLADWPVHISTNAIYKCAYSGYVRRMLQRVIRQHSEQCSCRRLNSCSPLPPSGDPVAMLQPPMPQVPQCHSERRKGARKVMTDLQLHCKGHTAAWVAAIERTCARLQE